MFCCVKPVSLVPFSSGSCHPGRSLCGSHAGIQPENRTTCRNVQPGTGASHRTWSTHSTAAKVETSKLPHTVFRSNYVSKSVNAGDVPKTFYAKTVCSLLIMAMTMPVRECCDANEEQYLLEYNAVWSIEGQPLVFWRNMSLRFSGLKILLATCFHACFLLCLWFDPGDGGDKLLWNVGWLLTYNMASCPRRRKRHNHCCETQKSYSVLILIRKYTTDYYISEQMLSEHQEIFHESVMKVHIST
jgi:hypothetical protein